jgi:hypothetical protein
MCNDLSLFKDYREAKKPIEINTAKGTKGVLYGYGRGNICIKQQRGFLLNLKDVIYVPDLDRNLISVSKIVENGGIVTFNSSGVKMTIDGKQVLQTGKENKLYNITAYAAITQQERTDLFHKRLGHASLKHMNKWALTVKGVRKFKDPGSFCATCALSKMSRKRFGKSIQETKMSGDLVVGDLEGPYPTLGPKREKFAFHLYDVHDGYLDSFAMKNKNDSEKIFNQYAEIALEGQSKHSAQMGGQSLSTGTST